MTSARLIDMTGQRCGRWIVVDGPVFPPEIVDNHAHWLCRCDCGTKQRVSGTALRLGLTVSCGCYKREIHTTHGMYQSAEYRIWSTRRPRCERWSSFKNFLDDMGPRPSPDHVLYQLDTARGFGPDNCRWGTWTDQAMAQDPTKRYRPTGPFARSRRGTWQPRS